MTLSRKLSVRQKQKFKRYLSKSLRVLFREPPLTGVEWADKNFYMSSESSYIEGSWLTAPSQIAILNSMCNDDIKEVNWKKSARVGYTKLVVICIAYGLEHKKRNVGVWQPDDGSRNKFSKKHIAPMIRDVGPMRSIFPYVGKKCSENTIENKSFTNGRELFLLGGKAAKNYRELSLDTCIYDELSQFDRDIEGDGLPTFIGDKRLNGSSFGKSIRGSSPTIQGECQVTEAFEECEHQFNRYVPCKHCGTFQTLVFGGKGAEFGFEWDKTLKHSARGRSAQYRCKDCSGTFGYADFLEADKSGYWLSDSIATYNSEVFYEREGFPEVKVITTTPEVVGWALWSIYSNFSPWSTIVTEWYKAQKSPQALKSFINTTLGEAFEEIEKIKTQPEDLFSRREQFNAQVPNEVVYITVGGDMQDTWAEFTVQGWTAGEESFFIESVEVHGDPSVGEFWDRLETALRKSYSKANGQLMTWATGVFDSAGHFTDEVYKFTKRFGIMRLFPGHGLSTYGKPIATKNKKKNSHGVYLVGIGTDTGKDMVYARAGITPKEQGVPNPGYMHFPIKEWCNIAFFEQLLAEYKKPEMIKGQTYFRWYNPPGKRNEKLDCAVYNLAALRLAQQMYALDLDGLMAAMTCESEPVNNIKNIGALFNGDN